jgi:hypothetical protein
VCDGYWNLPDYADGSVPIVNRTLGGCVIVRHWFNGTNRLDRVVLQPGWTYTVDANGDGTKSRVQVTVTETATGRESMLRVEAGKTKGK